VFHDFRKRDFVAPMFKADILNYKHKSQTNPRVGEFLLKTFVIPAKAGHVVKRQRYPESH